MTRRGVIAVSRSCEQTAWQAAWQSQIERAGTYVVDYVRTIQGRMSEFTGRKKEVRFLKIVPQASRVGGLIR
jgi:hypothetical protein